MAEARPYVINASVINTLNSAPVQNMRPSLGSVIQRKTIDIGCYPFPFMVNDENVPLDGRTIVVNGSPVKLPIRIVPFWCSENSYSRFPGDPTYNNGKIIWQGGKGYVKSNIEGNPLNLSPVFFYDNDMGITFPGVRYNTAFISMDNTVPKEWTDIKNAVLGSPTGFDDTEFSEGTTFEIANNILFKGWSGLTYQKMPGPPSPGGENTYGFLPMIEYNLAGGTYSPYFDRYNYECLDQIFNSPQFATIGINPNEFWEGYGATYGVSGGLSGAMFLLNAVTGGANAGSYFILDVENPLLDIYLFKGVTGILPGKQLAKNLYGVANEDPFIGIQEKIGANGNNAGFIETLAFLLATNQKFVNLTGTGGTASLRALDFNNPCSASFAYDESTVLGKWGYEVQPISIGEDAFDPGTVEVGCNINTFVEYMEGPTSAAHGIVHPLSWMFWRGLSSGNAIGSYAQGFIHDYVGNNELDEPIYNKLEGIHDYVCYEHYDNIGLLDRVYYPLRPITSQWYSQNVSPKYTIDVPGQIDAQSFGATLDQKYDIGFSDAFKGNGVIGTISLRKLQLDDLITINFEAGTNALNGVTGVMFPYFVPLASFAMQGINTNFPGSVTISGEFNRFDGTWTKELFNLSDVGDPPTLKAVYQYYAEGISADSDFGLDDSGSPSAPFTKDINVPPDFRLFSWNALSRIRPRNLQELEKVVKSSFNAIGADLYGKAQYSDPQNPNTLVLSGTNVDVDPINYPPNALPDSDFVGLTFEVMDGNVAVVAGLGCASYINVVRYANNNSPIEGTVPGSLGLTATRELISDVVLGASKISFLEFDPDKVIDVGNVSRNFNRAAFPPTPNNDSDFFSTDGSGFQNFFFTTSTDDSFVAIFENPYYLSAADYFSKYRGEGGQAPDTTWWENIDINNLLNDTFWPDIPSLAEDITIRLTNGEGWAGRVDAGFRSEPYIIEDPTNGVAEALMMGVHPSYVYRVFTTKVFGDLGIESDCALNWLSGGVPCHEIPGVLQQLKTNGGIYNSYFSGQVGCNAVGELIETVEDFENPIKKGRDFFDGCVVEASQGPFGPVFVYAFGDGSGSYPYSPFPKNNLNPYFLYQNVGCDSGTNIPDPPTNAALTLFGQQFAEALAIAENKIIDFGNASEVRDVLFAYTGNTASANGTDGEVPSVPKVSDWLQDKMGSIFDYWNNHRTDGDANLAVVENILSTLYPSTFSAYKSSFDNSSTFRVWAVKPKCVEAWTPECSELAKNLQNTNTQRAASMAPRDFIFRDEDINADADPSQRIISPPFGYDSPTVSPSTQITSNDIVIQNEGFIGAFRTIYIEPLGLAESVLATEAQEVPRATISSTVLGKLTTIIDSNGMLRDVNQITFESGFGTKIIGDNESGTIKLSVDGISLGSLTDVSITTLSDGDILVYDSELAKWRNRSISEFISPASFGADTNFFYQDGAPDAGITMGSRWLDSNTGIEYIYIYDGNSYQWIQAV